MEKSGVVVLSAFAPEVKVLRVVALKVSRDADELNHVGMGKVVHDVKLLMLFEININLSLSKAPDGARN